MSCSSLSSCNDCVYALVLKASYKHSDGMLRQYDSNLNVPGESPEKTAGLDGTDLMGLRFLLP